MVKLEQTFAFLSLLLAGMLFFVSCGQGREQGSVDQDQQAEKQQETLPPTGHFGETISKDGAVAIAEVMELITEHETIEVKVKGTIKEVCQHTGCWLTFDFPGGEEIMVRMKDHDFYVPMDAAGKTAWVAGTATREMISVAMLKHYAEDALKSQEEIDAITEPEMTYTLEARGVIIE